MKLDIEGSEFEAIGAADEATLRRFSMIYIELHGAGCNPNFSDVNLVRDRLYGFGFRQLHTLQQYGYELDAEGKPTPVEMMEIYVEKWGRDA